uniref:RT_RNaseH_2 domain-containing protein n=1 Tax=Strongyloides stercoralis TaxID=6248 RepID=A0A0K0E5Z2_STRER
MTSNVEEKMTCFRCNRKGHSATNFVAKSILIVKNPKFNKQYKFFILPIAINGKEKSYIIEMEYDTAATGSIISLKVAYRLGLTLAPSTTYISGVTDEFINCSILDICSLELNQISLKDLGEILCIKKLNDNDDDDDKQERKLARENFMTNAPITFPQLFSDTAGRLLCTVSLKFVENLRFRHIPFRPYSPNIKEEVVEHKINQYASEKESDEVISAFNICRNMLANLCTVRYYNGKDKLILESDASQDVIGSILLAKDDLNREWIILIHSRSLTKVEQVFPIQHKEALVFFYSGTKTL